MGGFHVPHGFSTGIYRRLHVYNSGYWFATGGSHVSPRAVRMFPQNDFKKRGKDTTSKCACQSPKRVSFHFFFIFFFIP